MEIIDRKENPLLNRVEIEFRWNHEGSATPSRAEMLNGIASIEPGSNRELIVIKDVKTRFGMGSTTGLGLVYSDKESMKVEPSYMHERYAELRSASQNLKRLQQKQKMFLEVRNDVQSKR